MKYACKKNKLQFTSLPSTLIAKKRFSSIMLFFNRKNQAKRSTLQFGTIYT